MIHKSSRLEYSAIVGSPHKSTEVLGPKGKTETLVADGQVDGFLADDHLGFPMLNFKDLQNLLKSTELAELRERNRIGLGPNWQFHTNPRSGNRTDTLSFRETRNTLELEWGQQKAVISGGKATLQSKIVGLYEPNVTHVMEGQLNAKGSYDCVSESYDLIDRSGNLYNIR